MKLRFATRCGALAVAGLLVTGCGLSNPGTAATVGDREVAVAEVQRTTAAYCDLVATQVATGQQQPSSLASQKQAIVGALVDTLSAEQLGAEQDVEASPAVVQYFLSGVRPVIAQVGDAEERETLSDFFDQFYRGQAITAGLAAKATGQELGPQNLSQLQQAGQQLLRQWQQGADIEVDPRYGLGADGQPAGGAASVSTAVSDVATASAQGASGAEAGASSSAASLPPSQRCGG